MNGNFMGRRLLTEALTVRDYVVSIGSFVIKSPIKNLATPYFTELDGLTLNPVFRF